MFPLLFSIPAFVVGASTVFFFGASGPPSFAFTTDGSADVAVVSTTSTQVFRVFFISASILVSLNTIFIPLSPYSEHIFNIVDK